ncbi:histidine phosphatase family protein [Galbitalea sp. SE-J8]|uniref:histidine phosphatase family protein n=1 Tax=Galbitalea sp. SE-J8 TaxID=3054952 RepID=UPI00259CA539|nr:histidine phosphatase family protein [Galbitalea sp. SE-J8]MDM4763149.1 histidine phosphatase family protein [Galbitalea sp. SE-J8]
MSHLYLVRHGETDWNRERRVQGSTDIPLNEMGRVQAIATGRLLATRRWDAIYASPLSRALETARIIARECGLGEPVVVPAIIERSYGEAEGMDHDSIDARFPGNTPVPGREHWRDVSARVVPALVEIAERHPGGEVLVVSHGGAIRSVLRVVDPDVIHPTIENGSVHSFRHTDGTLELVHFDDPIERASLEVGTGTLEVQNPAEDRAD